MTAAPNTFDTKIIQEDGYESDSNLLPNVTMHDYTSTYDDSKTGLLKADLDALEKVYLEIVVQLKAELDQANGNMAPFKETFLLARTISLFNEYKSKLAEAVAKIAVRCVLNMFCKLTISSSYLLLRYRVTIVRRRLRPLKSTRMRPRSSKLSSMKQMETWLL